MREYDNNRVIPSANYSKQVDSTRGKKNKEETRISGMCSTLRPVILLLLLLAGTATLLKGGEAAVASGSERSRLGTFRRVIENGCNLSVLGGTDSPSVLTCRAAGFLTVHQSLDSSSLQPYISNLTKLDLTSNNATDIPAGIFRRLVNLEILLLRKNRLKRIDERAFENLSNLRVLELDDNDLSDVPAAALASLVNLEDLSISNNGITRLEEGAFASCAKLVSLDLRGNPIRKIAGGTFDNLRKLRKLILSDLKGLVEFPNLNGTESLQILRIDRASLALLPDDFCLRCPRIRSLDAKSNRLRSVPNLGGCADLRVLDLASNRITSLSGRPFADLGSLHDLLLSNNNLREIPRDAFVGLSRLQILDLENNEIGYIDPEAFREFRRLEDLNLGNNVFPDLPVEGLSGVLHLKTFNNPALREFPPADSFPRVRTMLLSYAYHCCSFVRNEADEEERRRRRRPSGSSAVTVLGGGSAAAAAAATTSTSAAAVPIRESVLFPNDDEFDMNLWNSSFIDVWPRSHNSSGKSDSRLDELWDKFGGDFTYPGNPSYTEEEYLDEIDEQQREQDEMTQATSVGMVTSKANGLPPPPPPLLPPPLLPPSSIQCLPQPGPFLPCRDLFDWWTLRCGVWVVFLLAMLGNGTVVFVIVFSRSKMDVPRFLVCNLAAADFFMGIYLGLLAVVDASTLGEFRKYAIPWQMSVGCQLAGFLGVLSSELSVYTLAVITLERNYAITHAMHLNKRLSLRHAGYIMSIGWIFAVTMASLPLLGASDYRKFAICLPFETSGSAALGYVVFLMLVNGLAFLILMGCYLKMYCAIRGSQAWNSNDSRIAKRMALLVFTDFLCWSPIAFFSLTATFGLRLVSLEQAKVFAVFVLPLNSCCNPFLYAILTKQFKKDCVLICKAIEESRVTRGIGRCRHSSNFSNRQTPANTNSLVDRSSRDNNPPPTEEANHFEGGGCGCNAKLVRSGNPVTTTTTTTTAAAAAATAAAAAAAATTTTTTATTTTTSRRSAQRRNECGCADDDDGDDDDDDDDDDNDNDDDDDDDNDDDVEDDGGDEEEAEMEEVANAEKRRNNRAIAKTIVWWESLGCPCSSGGGGIGRNGDGGDAQPRRERRERDDRYAYRIAEIQQKQRKRASSSVSSSDNFSSSRSDSWRRHHCGIPLRPVEPAAKRRAASSWLVTRKPSQDSNLSSSRNDSSGSATTASTSTWRISRSSASIDAATATAIARTAVQPRPAAAAAAAVRPKPRLTRQLAIRDELTEPPGSGGAAAAAATASSCCSPSRLAAVRLLATIPSATEMSEQRDDETACSSSAVLRQ